MAFRDGGNFANCKICPHPEKLQFNYIFKFLFFFVSAPPLSFRMGFMLKHLLLSQDDPALSRNLLSHILKSCDIEPQKNTQNDKQIEDGLIQLLYCDRAGAKELVKSTKKPIKISLGQSLVQSAASRSAAASAAAAAAAAAKIATKPAITLKIGPKITPKMGPASKIGPASSKIAPKAVTNSGRPVRKVVYKEEPGIFYYS